MVIMKSLELNLDSKIRIEVVSSDIASNRFSLIKPINLSFISKKVLQLPP